MHLFHIFPRCVFQFCRSGIGIRCSTYTIHRMSLCNFIHYRHMRALHTTCNTSTQEQGVVKCHKCSFRSFRKKGHCTQHIELAVFTKKYEQAVIVKLNMGFLLDCQVIKADLGVGNGKQCNTSYGHNLIQN